jgi:UDP-N-acetylglucosamine 2-epimerase (non-hydrolysing)
VSNLDRFQKPSCWDDHNLKKESYFVLTLHRPSNVDDQNKLFGIINRILENTKDLPIVFPVHPRTRKNLEASSLSVDRLILLEPMSYLEFNYLVSNAKGVITDSGGITEETTYMKIPCITLRNTTERPETVTVGSNVLVGDDDNKFCQLMNELMSDNWKKSDIPALWDGKTAVRIVDIILNKIQKSSS